MICKRVRTPCPPSGSAHAGVRHFKVLLYIPTLKKDIVDPPFNVPYAISVCFAKSSALWMGDSILSTVRKAAKLAVYEDIMINVNNHHVLPTTLVLTARGLTSDPCCINVPTQNHKLLDNVNVFSTVSVSGLHGCGLYHSYGLNLARTNIVKLTTKYAATTYIHISIANGFIKENKPGFSRSGFLNNILIPRFRKGLVKSIYCSLS